MHVWLVRTRDIQMSIIMSITVSKVTANLTKHDSKLIKTVHKLEIVIESIGYHKIEHIGTKSY